MRIDPSRFHQANIQLSKEPRQIVNIVFDTGSIYCTSHSDISGVPGVVLQGVLQRPNVVTQRIVPDEGRSEIGAASFSLVDVGSAFTTDIRSKLAAGKGLRGKQVRFYRGFAGFQFSDFQLTATQIVADASYKDGVYAVKCRDITRAQRKNLFVLAETTLSANLSVTETGTIQVNNATAFNTVVHDADYTDAPSATVGYVKIKNEIIRYAGKTSTTFTGLTRGVFGTRPAAYDVDPATAQDRREKVSEYVYLEGPVPKILYAAQTGVLHGDSANLPATWHCGIDPALIRLTDYTGIGADLWVPGTPTLGVPCRFEGLSKADGKGFIEQQLLTLIGCYQPVYSDGALGLKRMTRILRDAAPIFELNESNCIVIGELEHDMESLHNDFRIQWNFNGEDFTRTNVLIDQDSIDAHGRADLLELAFKGLHGSRHTDGFILKMVDMLRDRYAGIPQRIRVRPLHALNRAEVGDVVRAKFASVRDYAGPAGTMDRSMEIQQASDDSEAFELELFGSTAAPSVKSPTTPATAIPDAWYTSQGTNLTSVLTIVGDVVQPGTYTLNGHADLNNAAAIFYYAGNLTIGSGVTINITGNVQLRIRGFLQINGTINGQGGGLAGVADSGASLLVDAGDGRGPGVFNTIGGNAGYVGGSRGMDGVQVKLFVRDNAVHTVPCAAVIGKHPAAPILALAVVAGALAGLPTDLRGTGGAPGGRGVEIDQEENLTNALGGSGAAGGAGLCIINRGMAFGASGTIDLDGNNSAATSQVTISDFPNSVVLGFAGAGGGGGPGALYVLLDGGGLSVPSIGINNFSARTGTVPVNGNVLPKRTFNDATGLVVDVVQPVGGYLDEGLISGLDLFNACQRVQYVPAVETPVADVNPRPPPPTNMVVTAEQDIIVVGVTVPINLPSTAVVRLYASITNNRPDAVKVGEGKQDLFPISSAVGVQRWFWTTTFDTATGRESEFLPATSTSTFTGTALGDAAAAWTPILSGIVRDGQTFTKATGSGTWNAAFRSQEGYEGCFVTWRPSQTNSALMVALNTDPAADDSYTSLDFAIYNVNNGTVEIYENGSPVSTHGSYAANDQFTITYDRVRLNYYHNATLLRSVVRVGLRLFADSSFFDVGGAINGVAFGSMGPAGATGGNLLRVDAWTAGALTASVGNFTLNQSASGENAIVNGTGPHGATQLLWECQCVDPGTGSGGEANGGWNNSADLAQLIDPTKSYRSTVWVRVRGALGANQFYHGCGVAGDTSDLGGSANSNPYFQNGVVHSGLFELDQWYLSVGIIHGAGYAGGNTGLAGIWDPRTGRRVFAGNEFRMTAGARTQNHRAYQYYGGNTTARQDLTEPRFEVMDGTEPTLASLLVPPDADNTLKKRLIPDEEFSLPSPSLYWRTSIGGGSSAITFNETGGLVGGRVTITWGQGGTTRLIALRNPPYQPVSEVTVIVTIRLRRTASLANAMTLQVDLVRDDDPSFGSVIAGDQEDLELSNTTLPNVNQWYEFVRTCYFFGEVAGTPYGAVSLLAIGGASVDGQSIEIDHLSANLGPPLFAEGLDGAVNAPSSVAQNKYLRDDNTWQGIAAPHVQGAGNDSITASFNLDGAYAEEFARCTNGSAITITLVNDSNSPMPQWATCIVMRAGSGGISFAAGSGVTIDGLTSVPSVGTAVAVTRTGANRYFVA